MSLYLQFSHLLVMLRPVGRAGRAKHYYSSLFIKALIKRFVPGERHSASILSKGLNLHYSFIKLIW